MGRWKTYELARSYTPVTHINDNVFEHSASRNTYFILGSRCYDRHTVRRYQQTPNVKGAKVATGREFQMNSQVFTHSTHYCKIRKRAARSLRLEHKGRKCHRKWISVSFQLQTGRTTCQYFEKALADSWTTDGTPSRFGGGEKGQHRHTTKSPTLQNIKEWHCT